MFYQRQFYRYSSLVCKFPAPIPSDNSIQAQASSWKYFCIFLQDKLDLCLMSFCYTYTGSYHHSPGSAIMYNTYGKENTDDDDVTGTYILLSGTLAVVTSLLSMILQCSPVIHVRCSLYPNTPPSLV